ncbi:MAG TPA: LecA/PA-IL family lectin, partial [Pyrinomonadaceae bacterium]|nr:LecA/PA-IL family lectin [Pyrinomonadaceae bacterium]
TAQTNRTNNPQTTSPKVSNPASTTQTTTSSTTTTSKPDPIQINVKVLADNTANGWTNSGWVVRKGQKIRISSSGRVSLGSGRFTTSAGISSLPDNDKLVKNGATGALIAVIGDDNNDFILVGEQREFIAERDGALFLGVNEGNLNDNSGAFSVTIEIDPTN